jgi:hypothetical protein
MKNLLALAVLLALFGCDTRTIEQQSGYAMAVTTPAIQADHRLNVHPIYCDSVQEEGWCCTYWRDGYKGRICGEYTAYPIIQPAK